MSARIVLAVLALAAVLALPGSAMAMKGFVAGDSLVGQVYSSVTHKGLPGYQVQLIAPKTENLPVRIAITDADGRYRFAKVWKGRCLLEVYWGLTLVSRQVIDTSTPSQFQVTLRPMTRASLARLQPTPAPQRVATAAPPMTGHP